MKLPKTSLQYAAAEGKVQTVFQGTTLRGLLLEAYGFCAMGQIALLGSIIAFILAGLMALLVLFGVLHAARTDEERVLFEHKAQNSTLVTA